MSTSDLLGTLGVALLLVAFLLNLNKKLSVDSLAYSILNIVGAALCGISSYMIDFYPFVVLESVWVIVAVIQLFKRNVPRGTSNQNVQ